MTKQATAAPAGVIAEILDQAERHLSEGHLQAALDVLRRSKLESPWIKNAVAVCQLRHGEIATACDTFRRLAVRDGMTLRRDIPPVFSANLAAALLANNNLTGYAAIMSQLRERDHPTVREIREAYSRWKRSLSLGQRLRLAFLEEAEPPFRFDFLVGALR